MEKRCENRPTRISKLFMCGTFTARFKSDVGNFNSVGKCSSVGRATAVITFINRPRNVKRYRRRSRSLSSPRQHSRRRCPCAAFIRAHRGVSKFYDDDNAKRDDVTRHRSLLFNSPGLPGLVFARPPFLSVSLHLQRSS